MATVETLSIDVKASVDKAVSSFNRVKGSLSSVSGESKSTTKAVKETALAFEATAEGVAKAAKHMRDAGFKNVGKDLQAAAKHIKAMNLKDVTDAMKKQADEFEAKGDKSTANFLRERANPVARESEVLSALQKEREAEKGIADEIKRKKELQKEAAKIFSDGEKLVQNIASQSAKKREAGQRAAEKIEKEIAVRSANVRASAVAQQAKQAQSANAALEKSRKETAQIFADGEKLVQEIANKNLAKKKIGQAASEKIEKEIAAAAARVRAAGVKEMQKRERAGNATPKADEDAEKAALEKAKADGEAEKAAKKRAKEEKDLNESLKAQASIFGKLRTALVNSQTRTTSLQNSSAIKTPTSKSKDDALNSAKATKDAKSVKELGKAFQKLGAILPKLESKLFGVFRMFGRIAMYRAVRAAIKALTSALKEGLTNLKAYSQEVGTAFAPAVDNLRSHVLWLKNAIATALRPVIEALIPVIQRLVDWLVKASDFLAQVFSVMTGKVDANGRYTKAVLTDIQDSNKEAKKLQRTLLGFDEINRLDGNDDDGNAQNAGLMFTQADVSDKAIEWAGKLSNALNKVKEIVGKIDWDAVLKVLAALKLTQILSKIVKWVKPLITLFGGKGGLVGIIALAIAAFALFGDKIAKGIANIRKKVSAFFDDLRAKCGGDGILATIIDLILNLVQTLASAIYKLAHGDVLGAINDILGFVSDLLNAIANAVRWLYNNAIQPALNWIIRGIANIGVWFNNLFIDIRIWLNEAWKWFLELLNDGLSVINDIVNSIIKFMNDTFDMGLEPINLKIDTSGVDKKIKDLEGKKLKPISETVEFVGKWKTPPAVNLRIDTSDASKAVDRLGAKVNRVGAALSSIEATARGNPYISYSPYASGGFPAMGSMFIAGEAGAEWVGDINGRTGVMNTEQMAAAMYEAVNAALANNPQGGGDIYLDGEVIYRNTVRRNNNQVRATGRTALLT